MSRPQEYNINEIQKWHSRARAIHQQKRYNPTRISKIIGDEIGVSPNTVRYYLFSKKGKGAYEKLYNYEYDLKYKHLIRRLDKLLPQFFNGNAELSLAELTDRIESNAGIAMRESTLEKLLGKYECNERGAPVIKAEAGKYELNQDFYGTNKNSV